MLLISYPSTKKQWCQVTFLIWQKILCFYHTDKCIGTTRQPLWFIYLRVPLPLPPPKVMSLRGFAATVWIEVIPNWTVKLKDHRSRIWGAQFTSLNINHGNELDEGKPMSVLTYNCRNPYQIRSMRGMMSSWMELDTNCSSFLLIDI